MNKVLKEVLSTSLYILIVLVLTLLLVKFVGQRTVVNGSSMETTLTDRDNLIVDKLSYRFGDPQRFDVVVFPYQNKKNIHFIKRIIGLPGETIQIDNNGNIYINGELLEEHYGFEKMEYPGVAAIPITLGENEYFVLGDNRNDSRDSRFEDVGPIPRSMLIGKAWVRFWPLHNAGKVDNIK